MNKESLHEELDRLTEFDQGKRSSLRLTVHALIDLGIVTEIACSWDDCAEESREFVVSSTQNPDPSGTRRTKQAHGHVMSIDHITPFSKGGTDRPENLRLVHLTCNMKMGRKLCSPRWTDAGRERAAAKHKALWETPEHRAKMAANSAAQSVRVRDRWAGKSEEEKIAYNKKVSDGLKASWARRNAAKEVSD